MTDPAPPTTCVESALFALQVTDASMAPEFPDGCVVVADPGLAPAAGEFVVASGSRGLLLRRLQHDDAGWWLETLDPDAPREPVTARDIRGTVVQRAGRRRREHKHYRGTRA